MSLCETDVAIVGAGPAGAAAALTIARYTSLSCVIVEATDLSAERPGESVSSALLPLLDYLGVAPPGSGTMLPLAGTEVHWGTQASDPPSHGQEPSAGSISLDRKAFDSRMAATAEDAGASLLRRCRLRGASPKSDGWTLYADGPESKVEIRAKFVVDASGRSSTFARMAGAGRSSRDRLVGVLGYASMEVGSTARSEFLLEAVREGWWYATPLPGNRVVLAFMTDADLVRSSGESVGTVFARRFEETAFVRKRFGSARPLGFPIVFPADASRLSDPSGLRWIAAGDAASSYDPLSSIGIGHAISGGIHAARLALAWLDHGTPATGYDADIRRQDDEHDRRQRSAYLAETRWTDSPFWARRHALAANS